MTTLYTVTGNFDIPVAWFGDREVTSPWALSRGSDTTGLDILSFLLFRDDLLQMRVSADLEHLSRYVCRLALHSSPA